ncbi:MAG TPA: hypothetical protein DEA63_04530 [Firmicutes bacterium]|nr:hypothetical protein [Bacillota bacterium]
MQSRFCHFENLPPTQSQSSERGDSPNVLAKAKEFFWKLLIHFFPVHLQTVWIVMGLFESSATPIKADVPLLKFGVAFHSFPSGDSFSAAARNREGP